MQREIRRKDRALDQADAWAIIDKADWGILSLVSADGLPYGVPLNHVRSGNTLYFHCARQGLKLELVGDGTPAHFTAVAHAQTQPEAFSTRYQSAMAQGHIAAVQDAGERLEALTVLCRRHAPQMMEQVPAYIEKHAAATVVLRLDVSHISAKARS